MKQNKRTMWILLCVLFLVWGAVAYRLIGALNPTEEPEGSAVSWSNGKQNSRSSRYVYVDDVRDPFRPPRLVRRDTTSKLSVNATVQSFQKPPFKLSGIVLNEKKKTAMLMGGDGTIHFLSEGDTLSGIKVINIQPRQVIYSYLKQKGEWSIE